MEMLLSKSQKSGMMGLGSIIFVLDIKAKLTDEEAALVKRYKMGGTVLYEKVPGVTGLANKMGTVASIGMHLAAKALQLPNAMRPGPIDTHYLHGMRLTDPRLIRRVHVDLMRTSSMACR